MPRVVLGILLFLTRVVLTNTKVFATQMSDRVITTQYGPIRGVLVTLPNRSLPPVEAYFGLQYASILGGELRFMPPTSPMETWREVRVALKFRPVCPQKVPSEEELRAKYPVGRAEHFIRLLPFLEQQAEECLNLNIYVPVRSKYIYFNCNIKICTKLTTNGIHSNFSMILPPFQIFHIFLSQF